MIWPDDLKYNFEETEGIKQRKCALNRKPNSETQTGTFELRAQKPIHIRCFVKLCCGMIRSDDLEYNSKETECITQRKCALLRNPKSETQG